MERDRAKQRVRRRNRYREGEMLGCKKGGNWKGGIMEGEA